MQGFIDTVQALISIVDGVMLAAKGPKIPMNPTPDEVIAGLREAFPSRVELADVLVPTASGPAVPARGDFQITPFSAWACSKEIEKSIDVLMCIEDFFRRSELAFK